MKPTIVLVHGAFAESASWNKVIDSLAGAGHPRDRRAQPAAQPGRRRGRGQRPPAHGRRAGRARRPLLRRDGDLQRPGRRRPRSPGSSTCAPSRPSPAIPATRWPRSSPAARWARRCGRFRAATGRPTCTSSPSGSTPSSAPTCPRRRRRGWPPRSGRRRWRRSPNRPAAGRCGASVPSWFLIGEQDRTIPAALQRFMAERAGARRAVEIPGASHAAAVSHPQETAELILEAAEER